MEVVSEVEAKAKSRETSVFAASKAGVVVPKKVAVAEEASPLEAVWKIVMVLVESTPVKEAEPLKPTASLRL